MMRSSKPPAHVALVAIMALVACVAGCKQTARTDAPADAGHAVEPSRANEVSVDPGLSSTGRIKIAPATKRALRGDLRIPAEVVSSESGAAEVSSLCQGRIATLEVREGDVVKRGQVLAWLDSQEAARLLADAIRARARTDVAQRKLERQEALMRERATSATAVDEARMELTTARADAAAARTLLASLGLWEPASAAGEAALSSRVPLRSPIDGVVTERLVVLGAPVSPDKTLFRVVASDRVVVDGLWGDPSALPPPPGTVAELRPRGGQAQATCGGHVVSSLAVVDGRTRARQVRVAPDKPCAFLLPGAFVDMAISSTPAAPGTVDGSVKLGEAAVAGAAPALVIAREAVVEVRGAPMVFVALPRPGAFVARVVRLGRTTSEDVAIEDGLTEGESVAIVGAVLLKGELLRAELEAP